VSNFIRWLPWYFRMGFMGVGLPQATFGCRLSPGAKKFN
jgi:hypothetical protein